jgi:hypothetical protein
VTIEVASFLATLALLGVTAWYAYLTHKMAASSEESSRQARSAAEAALKSTLIQVALLPVDFTLTLEPTPRSKVDTRTVLSAITLRSTAASVWLRSVELTAVSRLEGSREVWTELESIDLAGEAPLPRVVHNGEEWRGILRDSEGGYHSPWPMHRIRICVKYSLDLASEEFSKLITTNGISVL